MTIPEKKNLAEIRIVRRTNKKILLFIFLSKISASEKNDNYFLKANVDIFFLKIIHSTEANNTFSCDILSKIKKHDGTPRVVMIHKGQTKG